MNQSRLLVTAALILVSWCIAGCKPKPLPPRTNLQEAEYLRKKGDINGAVAAYRRHVDQRLESRDLPANEDPVFYLVVSGDLLMDAKRPADAYAAYKDAERRGVEKSLVAGRYVRVAEWYEWAKKYDDAARILREHSYLNPMLFDGKLDELERLRAK